jgi:hypothetical protein
VDTFITWRRRPPRPCPITTSWSLPNAAHALGVKTTKSDLFKHQRDTAGELEVKVRSEANLFYTPRSEKRRADLKLHLWMKVAIDTACTSFLSPLRAKHIYMLHSRRVSSYHLKWRMMYLRSERNCSIAISTTLERRPCEIYSNMMHSPFKYPASDFVYHTLWLHYQTSRLFMPALCCPLVLTMVCNTYPARSASTLKPYSRNSQFTMFWIGPGPRKAHCSDTYASGTWMRPCPRPAWRRTIM